MARKRKMAKYQVVITIGDKIMFDTTNSKDNVDEWLDEIEKAPCPMSVKVFEHDGDMSYELVCEKAKMPKEEKRLIGFCR